MFFSSQLRGSAGNILEQLRRLPASKRARFDVRSGGSNAKCLIIGIGQMHSVLHGRFEGFQAHRIAKVQAWIFRLCRVLYSEYKVDSFGQEGFSAPGAGLVTARLDPEHLAACKREMGSAARAEKYLRSVSDEWRRNLKRGNMDKAMKASTSLNALTILQSLEPRATVFPIEQRGVHDVIGAQIAGLHRDIEKAESSPAYFSARQKHGKGLTREEFEASVMRNALIKSYNQLLSHPERDRSIFRAVAECAQKRPVTVFVLGQAHRSAMLRLAREFLPNDAVFVWITPPALWWWAAIMRRIGWGILLLGVIGGFFLMRS